MRLLLWVSLIACLYLLACEKDATSSAKIEPGISAELAQYRAEQLSDIHYALKFSIPQAREQAIDASLILQFSLEEATHDLQLDFTAGENHIHSVEANGAPCSYRYEHDHLIVPNKALKVGKNEVIISFQAGDQSLNRKEDFLYTLLVPDRASTVFPCFDQPDLKASYSLELEVPPSWSAVANGALLESSEENDRKTLRFKDAGLFSTYLFAFAAGEFQQQTVMRGGQEMTMFYRESDEEKVARNVDAIFDLHQQSLEYMTQYTAIPLPFEKFDFALIPGFQYGGMEHVGSIFYRESSLMLDENATERQQLSRASLIAHETAHMWFGDLVTMRWFDDVWLKEVFANFMAAKIVNPSFPEINHELNFLLRHQPAAYGEDRSEGSHPIQQPLENLRDAGALYGRIIYQKAPVVMRQLESIMGPVAFRDGLRAYLRRFAYGNATWDDLISILDERSDTDLKTWSAIWVKQAGMPVFDVNTRFANDELVVTLSQRDTQRGVWAEETALAFFYHDSIHIRSWPTSAGSQLTLGIPPPEAVLGHASPMSYGYFPLDESSRNYLLANLPAVQDPVLRGSAWLSLYEDMLRGQFPPQTFFDALLDAIPQEQEPLNLNNLLNNLRVVYWRFLSAEERAGVLASLEAKLRTAWRSTPAGGRKTELFRAYYELAHSPAANAELLSIWEGKEVVPGLTLSESERIDMAAQLALRLPETAGSILDKQLAETVNLDRKRRLEFIRPALSADPATSAAFFASIEEEENRATEPWVVDAVGYLHHPIRAEASIAYLRPSLELMEEIKATGDIFFPRQFITATLGGYQSEAAAKIVRTFLEEQPAYPYRLRNKILMAADLLFRAANASE